MSFIPFLSLQHQHGQIKRELNRVFRTTIRKGKFILGNEVELFEKEYAAYQKLKYCAAVGNGHDALLISLKALGIGDGDEVIVPSYTCAATWLAVLNSGAKPIPVEIYPHTYNINVEQIEKSIAKKTKAILPVHLYGYPCEMDKINSVAKKNELVVIEDNAQAHGAVYKNKLTGSWGNCNATSFYPTKNLGALGDGGAITTNDKRLYDFARQFRDYGRDTNGNYALKGINSRLDEMQAAILRIKLKKLDEWNEARRKNASVYFEQLDGIEQIQLPQRGDRIRKPVFHLFVIRSTNRDKLKSFLFRNGIETAIHYQNPIHAQSAFKQLSYLKRSLPIAESVSNSVLSLPIWPGLKKTQIERICETIKKFTSDHL